jgi:1-deoxy-D-xylulose-5-phosphate reductoisomerase
MIFGARDQSDIPKIESVLARTVTVLGSTGSVGLSTLDVIAHARKKYGPQVFPIEALTAQSSVDKLIAQVRHFLPKLAVIGDTSLHVRLSEGLEGTGVEAASGEDAIVEAATRPSAVVMVAIVGAAGLPPALAAVERGATIALANKECIVAAGEIFRAALGRSRATVIPVDSEHNAVFQILDSDKTKAFERVTLTASGGPFREWPRERMASATPAQAVAHPNWSMGAKISVDSATLMNKGLELIEAHYLFGVPPDRLGVVVHPQSIIHCLVTYADGSTLAHLSMPDMRTPIAHALAWPHRIESPSPKLDLARVKSLTFEDPDFKRFPCLGLAEECLRAGGLAPTILNAANEVAVQAFLGKRIGFLDIVRVIEDTLATNDGSNTGGDLDGILAVDKRARRVAGDICRRVAA